MRDLEEHEIESLCNRPSVNAEYIRAFFGGYDHFPNMTQAEADLEMDTGLYGLDETTVAAAKDGLNMANRR